MAVTEEKQIVKVKRRYLQYIRRKGVNHCSYVQHFTLKIINILYFIRQINDHQIMRVCVCFST